MIDFLLKIKVRFIVIEMLSVLVSHKYAPAETCFSSHSNFPYHTKATDSDHMSPAYVLIWSNLFIIHYL